MTTSASNGSAAKRILLAGIVAGSIDICSAKFISGKTFGFIGRAIAGGVLGPASFADSWPASLLGVVLQWAMTMIIAAIYLGVTHPLPALRRNWIAGGLIAGAVTF